ncbi:hypothetical protein BC832DRAFT_376903 [Gaertneriomyces semiglobifer]|nr:hypothetical protein BC832DRAFT_376903 [Gaertneriomyces semiglobifer]
MNDNKKTSAINWDGSPGHMRGEKWTKGPPRTPNTTLGFASLFRDDTFTDQLFPAQSRERNLQFGLCGSSSELNHSDRASSNALLRKPADGPPTNSNSSLSENGMGGLAGLPCFQLGAGGVAAEETGDPELIPFELPRDEPDEDVFGLGEFKDVFISEEDLVG